MARALKKSMRKSRATSRSRVTRTDRILAAIVAPFQCASIGSRGDWLGNPANFIGTFCCFGFDVETYHHVTMTLHSLFQSKMADDADFLNGDDLEAILDILEADKEMEEEFIIEDENVVTVQGQYHVTTRKP